MRKLVILSALLLLGLMGCGGGGGGGSKTPTLEKATFQIAWPARSRDPLAHNLSSAQSAMVTLVNANPSGGDVQVPVDRDPARDEAYVGTYEVPQRVTKTFTAMTATFYAEPDEQGAVVGTASATVSVGSNGLSLASVEVVGKIKQVAVLPTETLTVGGPTVQLLVSATNENGATVAVSAGSASWSVTEGTAVTVTPDGVATAVAEGTVSVVVAVDGLTSPPAQVRAEDGIVQGASFRINWPERSRTALVHGLNSALSAVVTIPGAAEDGSDITLTVNRDSSNLTDHTEVYSVGQTVTTAARTLTAKFYSAQNATGELVGTASTDISINGSSLDLTTVSVVGTVKTVTILDPGRTLYVGAEPTQLLVSTKDETGKAIAVTLGSVRYLVSSGADVLSVTKDGLANGLKSGTATVSATVDGKNSPDLTINVLSTPEMTVVDLSVYEMAWDRTRQKIWASVQTDGGAYADSVVSIDPISGAIGDRIALDATPGEIAVSHDGQYAYVTLGNTRVRRLDLTTLSVDRTFTVAEGGPFVDLQVMPGYPKSFAAAIDPSGGVNLSVWDDDVRRAGYGATGYAIHFTNAFQILGDGRDSLFTNTLSGGGITWEQASLDVKGFDYAEGLIYTANGKIINPQTKATVMDLPTTHFMIDRELAAPEFENRVYYVTWDSGQDKRVVTFDRTSGEEKPLFQTGITVGGAKNVLALGDHMIAFHLFGDGVKRKPVIVRNLP